jgi:hypothetical protein
MGSKSNREPIESMRDAKYVEELDNDEKGN